MRCRTVRSSLSPWLDGRLDPAARAVLESHLASCPACAAEARALRRTDELVRAAMPPATPGADFFTSLERRVAREGAQRPVEAAAGIVRVRALVPMAAALVLGAATAFFGMRLSGRGATPTEAGAEPGTDAAVRNMAVASELVLAGLEQSSARDPRQSLDLARADARAVELDRVVAQARTMLPVLHARDRVYARQVEQAVEGTECVSRGLRQPGEPQAVLTSLRTEVEQRRLPRLVRSLVPGGVPRPIATRAWRAVKVGDGPGEAYDNGVRCYVNGDLDGATANFRVVLGATGDDPRAPRAAFLLSRTHAIEGRVAEALRVIEPLLRENEGVLREGLLGQVLEVQFESVDTHTVVLSPQGRKGLVLPGFQGRIRINVGGHLLEDGEIPERVLQSLAAEWVPQLERVSALEVDGEVIPAARLPAELGSALAAVSAGLARNGRLQIRPAGVAGEVGVEVVFTRVEFLTPDGKKLARLIGEARERPIVGEDGWSTVNRVVFRGHPVAPGLPRSPTPPAPPAPANPPVPPTPPVPPATKG